MFAEAIADYLKLIVRITAFIVGVLFAIVGIIMISGVTTAATDIVTDTQEITVFEDNEITPADDMVSSSVGPANQITGTRVSDVYLNRDSESATVELADSSSSLITPLNGTTATLSKVNNPLGNFSLVVLDDTNSVVHTFAEVNASGLTTTPTEYTYPAGSYTPSATDRIGILYEAEMIETATKRDDMSVSTGTGNVVLSSTGNTIAGEHVRFSNSTLFNKSINFLTANILKSNSPTGPVIAGVYDASGNTVFEIARIDAAILTTGELSYSFHNPFDSHTLTTGERVGVKFAGGDGTNTITVKVDNADPFDGNRSVRDRFSGGVWSADNGADWRFVVGEITLKEKSRYAVSLDGTDDYVTTQSSQILANQTSFATITMWVNVDQTKLQSLIGNYRSSTSEGWSLELTANNALLFRLYDNTGTSRTWDMKSFVPQDQWVFITISYLDDTVDFFVFDDDGLEIQERTVSVDTEIKLKSTAQAVRIGNRQAAGGEFCDCQIADVRVWNTTLGFNEIQDVYNGGLTTQLDNLRLWYKFDEGTSTITGDYSVNGNFTGTLQAGATWTENSWPHFVKVGITGDYSYDLTDTFTDPISGKRDTWIFGTGGWKDDPSILNAQLITDLKEVGTDVVVIAGIDPDLFDPAISPYSNVITWTALAKAAGLQVYFGTLESSDYLTDTVTYTETQLRNAIADVIVDTSGLGDAYVIDIEPENVANYATNATLRTELWTRYFTIVGWIVDEAHDRNELVYDWIAVDRHAEIQALAISKPNGINDSPTDATFVGSYKLTAALAEVAFNEVRTENPTNHDLIASVNLRDSNLPQLNKEEWDEFLPLVDSWVDSDSNVKGVSGYAWLDYLAKSDTVRTKHSISNFYNGTDFKQKLAYDIALTIYTVGNQSSVNADKANDGLTTVWESRVSDTNTWIYADLGESFNVHRVHLWKVYGFTPAQVQVFVSNDVNNFGSAVATASLTDATGLQTITLSEVKSGQYVKVAVSDPGDSNSVRLQEIDIDEQTSHIEEQEIISQDNTQAQNAVRQANSAGNAVIPILITIGGFSMAIGIIGPERFRPPGR